MISEIEDFKTGWYGIGLRFGLEEIDCLIESLEKLKDGEMDHFHFREDHTTEKTGIADIEISLKGEDEVDNMSIDTSLPHYPKGRQ